VQPKKCPLARCYSGSCMRARSHYHASLSQQEREEVQGAWTHDRVQIIVATIAFGMGALPPLR